MQYRSVTVLAPAKLNLSLDVVGTLPNGYHDLDMVMQTIDLYEKITLRRSNDLSLTLPGSFVPVNDKNTAVKAALLRGAKQVEGRRGRAMCVARSQKTKREKTNAGVKRQVNGMLFTVKCALQDFTTREDGWHVMDR